MDSEIECHTHNIPKNSIHIPKNNVRISMDLGVVHWYLQAQLLILSNTKLVFSWCGHHGCPITVLPGELCVCIKKNF